MIWSSIIHYIINNKSSQISQAWLLMAKNTFINKKVFKMYNLTYSLQRSQKYVQILHLMSTNFI